MVAGGTGERKSAAIWVAAAALAAGSVGWGQSAPKFEVASIKACKAGGPAPESSGPKGGRGPGAGGTSSPIRLDLPCLPLRFFIQLAYIIPAGGINNGAPNATLEGGPAWIDSERYQIDAKAEGPASKEEMNGPMLRALLEDRFQLKTHRETRQVPVYALTVAKGGLKLHPTNGRSCAARDLTQPSTPPAPGKPWCGQLKSVVNSERITMDLPGASLAEFARSLASAGRPVVDKTGVEEKFDFHLEYAPDGVDAPDDLAAPPVFSALGELGLRLEPDKGTREFVVIDRVERASGN